MKPVHPKGNQAWLFIRGTDTKTETPILLPPDVKNWLIWKDPYWERLKVGGEGDNRGWDGLMASPTQRTWVWVNSGSWWWAGRPAMLQSMELQRVRHEEWLNWTVVSIWSAVFLEYSTSSEVRVLLCKTIRKNYLLYFLFLNFKDKFSTEKAELRRNVNTIKRKATQRKNHSANSFVYKILPLNCYTEMLTVCYNPLIHRYSIRTLLKMLLWSAEHCIYLLV